MLDKNTQEVLFEVAAGKRWLIGDSVQAAVSESIHVMDNLMKTMTTLTKDNRKLSQNYQVLERELEQLKEANGQRVKQLTKENNELQLQLDEATKGATNLVQSFDKATLDLREAKAELAKYKKDSVVYSQAENALRKEITSLVANKKVCEDGLVKKQEEVDKVKHELAQSKEALRIAHGRIAQAESKANTIQQSLRVAETALAKKTDSKVELLELINKLKLAVENI